MDLKLNCKVKNRVIRLKGTVITMSREINNSEYRKEVLKELLNELHNGKTVDDVKEKFKKTFGTVSATEISKAEQELIADGLDVNEIQRLCDVHAAVFEGSIEEIHNALSPMETPGHPANTIVVENNAIDILIKNKIRPMLIDVKEGKKDINSLKEDLTKLQQIDRHYLRKENLVFPFMEKHGITAPPKVMWGVDDEIRVNLKEAVNLVIEGKTEAVSKLQEVLDSIEQMIFKEDSIMLPMVLDVFSDEDWKAIEVESDEFGYCLIEKPVQWSPIVEYKETTKTAAATGIVQMPTGTLEIPEITAILDTLPVDITFVGKDETVKYFSQGAERIFPRTKSIIGRDVKNCHPPASMHVVEQIVEDLKSGKKSSEEFWIRMKGKIIYIRYFAVRDDKGEFLGVLEVTQDITNIQQLTGEKRLLSE